MEKWIHSPPLLQQKIVLTLFLGVGIMGVATVMFFLSKDHILLVLAACIFLGCVLKSIRFWGIIVREEYETVTGICIGIQAVPFRRYRKIFLQDEAGNETILLLEKRQPLKPGCSYRFYFQRNGPVSVGSEYLDAMFSADHFLGCEEQHPEI